MYTAQSMLRNLCDAIYSVQSTQCNVVQSMCCNMRCKLCGATHAVQSMRCIPTYALHLVRCNACDAIFAVQCAVQPMRCRVRGEIYAVLSMLRNPCDAISVALPLR